MKEIRETQLNRITGIHTILLPQNAIILTATTYADSGITLLYEKDKTDAEPPLNEFTFHVTASFDFIPIESTFIGSIVDGNSLLHVYQGD
jgi:hypothetical protein